MAKKKILKKAKTGLLNANGLVLICQDIIFNGQENTLKCQCMGFKAKLMLLKSKIVHEMTFMGQD